MKSVLGDILRGLQSIFCKKDTDSGMTAFDHCSSTMKRNKSGKAGFQLAGVFNVKCFDRNGKLKWEEDINNLVVNVGLQHILDTEFQSGTPVTTWYVGLTNGSPTPAAANTMSTHTGWTENAAYSQSTRPTWTSTRSSQTCTNSAAKAEFSINADSQTLGGAFIVSNNTKSGSTGTLMCCGAFSGGNQTANNGDTIQVTYSISAADDGV